MTNTTFAQILYEWNKLNSSDRLKILQRFEEDLSKTQNRSPREIIIDRSLNFSDGVGEVARYNPLEKDNINIVDLSQIDALLATESVAHEGFHASVDDYLKDRNNLYAYSKIDENKFKQHFEFVKILKFNAVMNDQNEIYQSQAFDEQLAENEATMQLIYFMLKSCDGINDCLFFMPYLLKSLNVLILQKRIMQKQKSLGFDLDEIHQWIVKLDAGPLSNLKQVIKTTKQIKDNQNPVILNLFNNCLNDLNIAKNSHDDKVIDNTVKNISIQFINTAIRK